MNIVFLTPRFYPSKGGVEKHLYELINNLDDKYKITVFVPNRVIGEIGNLCLSRTVNVIYYNELINSSSKLSRYIKFFIKYWKYFINADVIHSHDYEVFFNTVILLRFIFFNKKFCITFHGWEGVYPPQKRNVILRKIAATLNNSNLCIGKYIEDSFGVKADRISYGAIYNKNVTNYQKKDIDYLYVGRFENDTGVKTYIDYLIFLKQKNQVFNAVFCGDGQLKKDLENDAILHSLNITFTGWIENVDEYYSRSNIILTSGYLALLEAWSHKKVVISTYDNPIKEAYIRSIPDYESKLLIIDSNSSFEDVFLFTKDNKRLTDLREKSFKWATNQTWIKMVSIYKDLWFEKK